MLAQEEKKPGMAAMIVSKMAKPEEKEVENESEGLDSAVEEILSAIESKNKEALKEALKSFIELCDEDSEEVEAPEAE